MTQINYDNEPTFSSRYLKDFVDQHLEEMAQRIPTDSVDHPPHYSGLPNDIECIDIVEHMNFCRGNAIKYIWRVGLKCDVIEDLEKAIWYLNREIQRIESFER